MNNIGGNIQEGTKSYIFLVFAIYFNNLLS